jgi:hypothetical protein
MGTWVVGFVTATTPQRPSYKQKQASHLQVNFLSETNTTLYWKAVVLVLCAVA